MRIPQAVKAALRALPPPRPFDLGLYLWQLQEHRNRPIHIHDLPTSAVAALCGAWIAFQGVDHVFVDPAAAGRHRDHIIAHEIAHMLLNHRPSTTLNHGARRTLLDMIGAPPTLRVSTRAGHDRHERAAELFATLALTGQGEPPQRTRVERAFSALDWP